MTEPLVSVEFEIEEVQGVSLDLLGLLEDNKVTLGVGIAALGLALGIMLAQRPISQTDAAKFSADLVEWVGMYFAEGGTN